ncbi:hypothetical protein CEXT_660941 [Caerostris extrusa]|uniref:RING-type domain-containing protein n=1 Tax=Caerostris extrusa TaxID=172846 RepID=A0AAV4UQW3_CAEEX|nr:hypothetical protein CEXT_660941 [Caerostris extrusa]
MVYHPYALLAAGVFGAALALIVYFTVDHQPRRRVATQYRDRPPNLSQYYNEDSMCITCYDRERSVKFLPCGHDCLCKQCYDIFRSYSSRCLLCRETINTFITI